MNARLRIEQYVHQVTEVLYDNSSDPVGLAPEQNKSSLVSVLGKSLEDLRQSFKESAEMSGKPPLRRLCERDEEKEYIAKLYSRYECFVCSCCSFTLSIDSLLRFDLDANVRSVSKASLVGHKRLC